MKTGGQKPFSELLDDLSQAFTSNERPDETVEEQAAAVLEFVLDRERLRHQVVPGTSAAADVDRQTLAKMRAWDTDDPTLAVIEKVLRRLAEGRGEDALTLLEKAIDKKEHAVSDEQRRRASTPRQPHPVFRLIEEIVAANPRISAKELERALKAQTGKGVVSFMDDTEISPVDIGKPAIKTARLPDLLTKARKNLQSRL